MLLPTIWGFINIFKNHEELFREAFVLDYSILFQSSLSVAFAIPVRKKKPLTEAELELRRQRRQEAAAKRAKMMEDKKRQEEEEKRRKK